RNSLRDKSRRYGRCDDLIRRRTYRHYVSCMSFFCHNSLTLMSEPIAYPDGLLCHLEHYDEIEQTHSCSGHAAGYRRRRGAGSGAAG
ncbi:hypothetical protein ACOZB2_21905, partial [Pantoea endophytica]